MWAAGGKRHPGTTFVFNRFDSLDNFYFINCSQPWFLCKDLRRNAGRQLCKKEQLTGAVSLGIRGGIVCVPRHTREETCLILQPGRPRRPCPALNAITSWRSHAPATRPSCVVLSVASVFRWSGSSVRRMKPWNASSKASTSTVSRHEPAAKGRPSARAGAVRRRACRHPAVFRRGDAAGRMTLFPQKKGCCFFRVMKTARMGRAMRAVFMFAERKGISRAWAIPGWPGQTRPPAS